MYMKQVFYLLGFTLALVAGCKKDSGNGPDNPPVDTSMVLTPYEIIPPAFFPEMIIPEDNKPFVERIKLGRMLYYDPSLSNDGRSCAGCHLQAKGFTKDGLVGGMPVLPHVNLGWYSRFMWNGSQQGSLEDVMLFETRDFFLTDLTKMNANQTYKELFRKHFGVSYITHKEIAYALAQFVRTQISRDTKYDRYIRGEAELTYDEMQGRNLFFTERGDCFHCHSNPMMTDDAFHNTGLDSLYAKEEDKGLYHVTGKVADMGKFRTANLRNVALRTRFMHDGRFSSLEEVIEFYNSGVRRVGNLDPIMTKPGKENGLKLTAAEKYQLLQFLKTLTDETFINDTTLSAP
jgi:cytochrome c peroxidase